MIHKQINIINNKFLYFMDRLNINLNKINFNNNKDLFNDHGWQKCYENLISNGYAKLPIKFNLNNYENLNDLFDPNFKFEDFYLISEINKCNKYGCSNTCLSMKSPIIKKLFSKELHLLIKSFYNENFFVRNCPFLRLDIENQREVNHDQSLYHLDHAVRQLSIIIFVNSLNEKSSHTKYIEKTHLNSWLNLRERDFNRHSSKFKKIVNDYEKNNEIKSLIGSSGEAYIFDAGNGLHKGHYGKDRGIIHLTFSKSRRYAYYKKDFEINYRKNASNNFEKYYFGPLDLDNNLLQEYEQNNWTKENFKYLIN